VENSICYDIKIAHQYEVEIRYISMVKIKVVLLVRKPSNRYSSFVPGSKEGNVAYWP